MNALTRAATSTIPRVVLARRTLATMSTGATAGPLVEPTFQKTWLSDPATYPIIFVLGFAVTLASSFIGYKFSYCGDVRVSSKTKGQVLRSW